jgi:hypothetical protein
MHAGRVVDLADDLVLERVDHHDDIAVAEIEPVRGGIQVKIIPAAVTADRDFLEEMVGSVGGRGVGTGQCGEESEREKRAQDDGFHGRIGRSEMREEEKGRSRLTSGKSVIPRAADRSEIE